MTKVFIVGINGKMGQAICNRAGNQKDIEVVGGFDMQANAAKNIFNRTDSVNMPYDVIIDFSRPESLDAVIALSKSRVPVVLATTGYSKKDNFKIEQLAKSVPVFVSGNMSFGVSIVQKLVEEATRNLWGCFDVEIVEKHHNQKVDAPSGTARMLAASVEKTAVPAPCFLTCRSGNDCKRKPCEVTMHSVRGGTVVGEHEVIFYGNDEVISIKHSALSRNIFADGALRAAKFLIGKPVSLYSMASMIKNQ